MEDYIDWDDEDTYGDAMLYDGDEDWEFDEYERQQEEEYASWYEEL